MKATILSMAGASMLLMLAAACNDDERLVGEGEGKVIISPEILSDVTVVSRAAADEDQLNESLILWISNSKGPVRKYNGKSEIPAEEWLASDHYVAEAWAGDSVSASFDSRWFKGSKEFDVAAGQTEQVTVQCKIANVLVSVEYAEGIDAVLSDYTMTVGHSRGEVTFEGADTRTAYFMMPSSDTDLAWSLSGKMSDGSDFERTGVIADAKPATKYVLTVRYDSSSDEIGGAIIGIEVDQTEVEVYDDILIELPPIIQGYDFDLSQPVTAEPGKAGRRSVYVTASTEITSATVSIDGFSTLLGIKDDTDADFNDFDVLTCSDAFRQRLLEAGVDCIYDYDATEDVASLKIIFEETFTSRLVDEGVYPFVIEVADKDGRKSTAMLTVNISNAALALAEVVRSDIWSHSAVIRATALRDDYGNATFEYRKQGATDWTTATPMADGLSLSASLTDLDAATTYEYRIRTDIDDFVSDALTFTTESTTQLPNAGFENWQAESAPYLIYGSGEEMFWDSGNHGSAIMSRNITMPDSEVRHSGQYSVKLKSDYVVIKFAAGNIFAGEYLTTEQVSHGVLGWGRSFESRPTALHGYIKYTPGSINRGTVSDIPGSPVAKGDTDRGIVYVALLDNSVMKTYNDKSYPVIVRTYTKEFFSKDDSNVLAYGEQIWTAATEGDGMIEFTIPLDYSRTDVVPSYIVLTCSASQYGDYFVGSDSSVMWLDDLELVYDK